MYEAVTYCRKSADVRPREPKYAYTLAFYLNEKGDRIDSWIPLPLHYGVRCLIKFFSKLLERLFGLRIAVYLSWFSSQRLRW